MATKHERRCLESIACLFNNKQYSDLDIKCDGRTFHVHKAIVCPAVPFLSAAVKHEFEESKSNTITHEEFDADTVQLVLAYIYTHNYSMADKIEDATVPSMDEPASWSLTGAHVTSQLITHARVFGLADYWGMPDLMALAAEKFTIDGNRGPIDPDHFVDVVKEVYLRNGPNAKELLDAWRVVGRTHRRDLAGHQSFLTNLVDCIDVQGYAVEMIQELNRPARKESNVIDLTGASASCRSCGNALDVVVVDYEGYRGSEQDFSIKCDRCKYELFRH